MNIQQLNKELGNIDLYLLDQLLKDNISGNAKILDAGCGEGRNLIYFLNNGYEVFGIDKNPDAIRLLKFIIRANYPQYPKDNFIEGDLLNMRYPASSFDYVICSAVLHFANSVEEFWSQVEAISKVLKVNGTLFIRMTSDIGQENYKLIADGKYALPDGTDRFLLNQSIIHEMKNNFNYQDVEPTKTINVDNQRCMTTLVLKKWK